MHESADDYHVDKVQEGYALDLVEDYGENQCKEIETRPSISAYNLYEVNRLSDDVHEYAGHKHLEYQQPKCLPNVTVIVNYSY